MNRKPGNKRSFLLKLRPFVLGASAGDIALLLLVFFMASTSTEPPKGVEVNLPLAQTQSIDQEGLYITVSKQGALYMDGKQMTLQEISDNLAMRQSEKEHVISITADRNLEYRQIRPLLDVLKEQDFLNVAFISEARKDKP